MTSSPEVWPRIPRRGFRRQVNWPGRPPRRRRSHRGRFPSWFIRAQARPRRAARGRSPRPTRIRTTPATAHTRRLHLHLQGRGAAAYRSSSLRRRSRCWPSRGCWRRYRFSAAPATVRGPKCLRPQRRSRRKRLLQRRRRHCHVPCRAPTGWGSSASRRVAIRGIRRRWWCEPPCHSRWCVKPRRAVSITAASGSAMAPTSNSPTRCAPSGGFDVTNPADGTRYEVRPQRLKIISNGHVDSSEPVLQYASAT